MALVYGISDYGGGDNDLNYTDDDAEDFAALLTAKGWNVRLRINGTAGSEATLDRLKTDVAELSQLMRSGDRLLFYYSGHGVYANLSGGEPVSAADSYDELLLLYDSLPTLQAATTAAEVLSVTVSDDSLAALLGTLPASTKTIILDSCFSGGFIGDSFTVDTTAADYTKFQHENVFYPAEAFSLYMDYTPSDADLPASGFSVLTAAGESEESFESSTIQHGYFTYFLLHSPQYADYNNDGYISLTEAYAYTAASIDNLNKGSLTYDYLPHVAAFPVDPVLFAAD